MEYLRKSGKVRPDALILGAQTENNLIVAERGVMWARLTTKGKAAHAGNPAAGDNAILRMMRLAAAHMANRKGANIINISSSAAFQGGGYGNSKLAVIGLTMTFARELAAEGIILEDKPDGTTTWWRKD